MIDHHRWTERLDRHVRITEGHADRGHAAIDCNLEVVEAVADHHAAGDIAASEADGSNQIDRKSTRLNSSHVEISYAVFCLKKKKYALVAAAIAIVVVLWVK